MKALRELDSEISVQICHDGQQLLDTLQETHSDKSEIIFLDINMPCKNGFECLKQIRSDTSLDTVKIIMFSTSSRLHIELSYKLGADFYAVKPVLFSISKKYCEIY